MPNGRALDLLQHGLDRALNGREAGLHLPAVILRAVVADGDANAAHEGRFSDAAVGRRTRAGFLHRYAVAAEWALLGLPGGDALEPPAPSAARPDPTRASAAIARGTGAQDLHALASPQHVDHFARTASRGHYIFDHHRSDLAGLDEKPRRRTIFPALSRSVKMKRQPKAPRDFVSDNQSANGERRDQIASR